MNMFSALIFAAAVGFVAGDATRNSAPQRCYRAGGGEGTEGGVGVGVEEGEGAPRTPVASSIIEAPLLECPKPCEVRLRDGRCRVDLSCLLSSAPEFPFLHSSAVVEEDEITLEKEMVPDEDPRSRVRWSSRGMEANEDSRASSLPCRGHCVFSDVSGNCRLDLVCLMGRDANSTLAFFSDFPSYRLAAGALSRSASLSAPLPNSAHPDSLEKTDTRTTEAHTDAQAGTHTLPKREISPTYMIQPRFRSESIVVSPVRDCSGKCKVRNDMGECVTDYTCSDILV